ncbi:11122_t:CDS:2, partial [Diversispora eburnea]
KIDVRQIMLNTEPKSIIDRVLNRESRQIVLDRIIQNHNNNTVTIIINPEQIKSCVQEHLYQWTEEQQFRHKWNGNNIDTSIKKHIKKETNWKWSQELWQQSKITDNKTSTRDNSLRSFSIKLLNEELPTMKVLHTRKPEIYKDKKCPFCNIYDETNAHVFMCKDTPNTLKNTFCYILKKVFTQETGKKTDSNMLKKYTIVTFSNEKLHKSSCNNENSYTQNISQMERNTSKSKGKRPFDNFEYLELKKQLVQWEKKISIE